MSSNLLRLQDVVKQFGGFKAVDHMELTMGRGEMLGLVGPNGSGKTTCINIISGLLRPDHGQVTLGEQDVTGWAPERLVHHGINRTFQLPKPFKSLTVAENVAIARRYGKPQRPVEDPLAFVGLSDAAHRVAGQLNSAQQKLLDLARALATGPDLLLVDELAAGLTPAEMEHIATKLLTLVDDGMSLLVVEHHMQFINRLTERVIVMNLGRPIFEGSLAEAAHDPTVVEVYLGTSHVDPNILLPQSPSP